MNIARRRSTQAIAAILGALLLATFVSVAGSTRAEASAAATVKVTTQRMSQPNLGSTQAGTYAVNTTVTLLCFEHGQSVAGYYSAYVAGGHSDVWYLVSDGYFIADIDIDTGSNSTITPACPASFLSAPNPTVSGTVAVGATVSANAGSWQPSPSSLTYQWLRNGAAISGATASTYKVAADDGGKSLSVRVTASRAYFSTTAKASGAQTARYQFTTAPNPKVSGTGKIGSTLTATPGTWAPAPTSVSYQWLRNGSAIGGATGATYKITTADAGSNVVVKVTARRSGYLAKTRQSSATVVPGVFTTAPIPTLSGSVALGSTVTANPGTWVPTATSLSYQWLVDSKPVQGATGVTYTPVSGDLGKQLKVKVTARASGMTTVVTVSKGATINRSFSVAGTTKVTGTARVGQVLTAHPATWSPTPSSVSYTWLRDGVAISGATSSTYTLTSADGGKSVRAKAVASRAGYASRSSVSWPVTVDPGQVVFTASIAGSATVGSTLSASVNSTGAAASAWAYQWYAGGSAVSGANAQSWSVPAWAAGASVYVRVTGQRTGTADVSVNTASVGISGTIQTSVNAAAHLPVGSALRSPNGRFHLEVQGDGNVVVYDNATAIWSTGTNGNSIAGFDIQGDGNLVVYRASDHHPIWASSSSGSPRNLTMQDDGNLVLYGTDGKVMWASKPIVTPGTGVDGWAYPILPHSTLTTYSGHNGDDFPVGVGTPVYSMSAGTVSFNSYAVTSAWCPISAAWGGQQTDLRVSTGRDGKTYLLTYAHLNSYSVSSGQTVAAGQLLGYSGTKGCSSGPHLHVDMKVNGVANQLYPHNIFGTSY